MRLGISAACGPNSKGRSKISGSPFLLQGCVFDRAERTAEKDGALFSRRATKSGCLRLLQVKSTLWDYNTIRLRGGIGSRHFSYSSYSNGDLDPENSLSQKGSVSAIPGGGGGGPGAGRAPTDFEDGIETEKSKDECQGIIIKAFSFL